MLSGSKKKAVLEYAKTVYTQCKAYNGFLKSKGILSLRQFPDKFDQLPLTNKRNYLEIYKPEEKLMGNKILSQHYMICTSSGSTGKPTIWPRDYISDNKAIEFNRKIYSELYDIENKKTLVVVTFGLGAWTAGMLTARLCWETSKNMKLSVVTPGLDKEVSLRVIRELSKNYDQTIITGYPPFIIDLIEYGNNEGFDFRKVNTKIHYTSARLLEKQRDQIVQMISDKKSRYDVLGFYACSEAGIIGIETPETVDILEYANNSEDFSKMLFKNPIPPTFVMYDPRTRFLEEFQGRILLTVDQAIPLVRYDINDRGGILDGKYLSQVCKKFGYIFPKSLLNKNFVYIFGRADAIRLLNDVYIDDVQYCLNNSKMGHKLTGNFKYGLEEEGLRNILKIIVYLKIGKKISRKEEEYFNKEFNNNLLEVNPDFKMVSKGIRFSFKIEFTYEPNIKYTSGKFNYFI